LFLEAFAVGDGTLLNCSSSFTRSGKAYFSDKLKTKTR